MMIKHKPSKEYLNAIINESKNRFTFTLDVPMTLCGLRVDVYNKEDDSFRAVHFCNVHSPNYYSDEYINCEACVLLDGLS